MGYVPEMEFAPNHQINLPVNAMLISLDEVVNSLMRRKQLLLRFIYDSCPNH